MKQTIAATALLLAALAVPGGAAQRTKTPDDPCPRGYQKVTETREISVDAKPGGVGGGTTQTETREYCEKTTAPEPRASRK